MRGSRVNGQSLAGTIVDENFTGYVFVPYPAIFLSERQKITKKYDHRK
jgi:hypothetical protein